MLMLAKVLFVLLLQTAGANGFFGLFDTFRERKLDKLKQQERVQRWEVQEHAGRLQAIALARATKTAAAAAIEANGDAGDAGSKSMPFLSRPSSRSGLKGLHLTHLQHLNEAGSKFGVLDHHLSYTIPYWWSGGEPPDGTEPPKKDRLLFNHIPKTGGTFVKTLLNAAVPNSNRAKPLYACSRGISNPYIPTVHFGKKHYAKCGKAKATESVDGPTCRNSATSTCGWIRHEKESHAATDAASTFVIAGIRNPCDYYLSLWAFGSAGEKSGFKLQNPDILPLYSKDGAPFLTAADKDLFYKWLVHPKVRGLLTERVVGSVGWQPTGTMDAAAVDCWLHSDHLLPTLRVCLKQFEARGGKVNWDKYEKTIEDNEPSLSNLPTSINDTDADISKVTIDKNSIRNASPHGKCSEHYNSSGIQVVMASDSDIFRLFPFDTCCSHQLHV